MKKLISLISILAFFSHHAMANFSDHGTRGGTNFQVALLAINRDAAIERNCIGQSHDQFYRRLKRAKTGQALVARREHRRRSGQYLLAVKISLPLAVVEQPYFPFPDVAQRLMPASVKRVCPDPPIVREVTILSRDHGPLFR